MIGVEIALMVVWGGVVWRSRGGGFTALTGLDPGTGGMRALAAVWLCLPLASHGWRWLVLIPAMWIGMSIAGWGAFQSMEPPYMTDPKDPLCPILRRLGLANLAGDVVGMWIAGLKCLIVPALAALWPAGPHGLWLLVAIVWFPVGYLLAIRGRVGVDLGVFAKRGTTQWGEILAGGGIGGTLMAVAAT